MLYMLDDDTKTAPEAPEAVMSGSPDPVEIG